MTDKPEKIDQLKQKNYFKVPQAPISQSRVFDKQSQQCRICLEPIQQNQVPGICRCKGNSALSHKHCLIQWVKKSPQQHYHTKLITVCEICKTPIFLQTQKIIKCISLDDFKFIKKENYCTVVIFVLFFVGIMGLGVSVYGVSKNQQNEEIRKQFLIGIILSSAVLFVDIAAYLVHTLTYFQVQIVGFKNLKQMELNHIKRSQTIPIIQLKNQSRNESWITSLQQIAIQ